ncbi:MAG: tetratricopeptide repeat protein [Gammaproteobacteria bacterium]|nr:tetratricopeptide repeat protein [Gammaproteobacteria bacterium]
MMGIRSIAGASLMVLLLLPLFSCGGSKEERKSRYFQRGMELYEQGDFVKARLEFKNVLQIDPNDAQGHYMFGRIEEQEQEWRNAFALFTRAVELEPTHKDAQLRLGRLYLLSGASEKALESAARVLQLHPEDPGALVLQGLANAKLGNTEEAIQQARSAIDLAPEDIDAISLLSALLAERGDMDEAILLARKGVEKQPEMHSLHALLARLYARSGDTEGAISELRRMIELKPSELAARMRLATYHIEKGDLAAGELVLREAVAGIPDSVDAKLALVRFLGKHGTAGEDSETLKAFIQASPNVSALQFELARQYTGRKDLAQAKRIYRQIIDNAGESPGGETARTLLAGILVSEREIDVARQMIEEALQQNPRNKEALLLRAAISLENEDPDKGISDLRTLLKDDPGYVRAHRLKARAHLLKNEIALARQSLEDAIQASPQEAAANLELVQLLLNSGQPDEAVTALERILGFAPDNLAVSQMIASIRAKQEDWDALTRIAQKIHDTFPESPVGYYYLGVALQGEKRLEESNQQLEQSLRLNPDASEPLLALSRNFIAMGQSEQALERVRQVVEHNPEHAPARNLEGEILLGLKRYNDAAKVFEQVIERRPAWGRPYRNLARTRLALGDAAAATAVIRNGFEHSADPLLGLELALHLDRSGDRPAAAAIYQSLLERYPRMDVAANNYAMLLLRKTPSQAELDLAAALVKRFEFSNNATYLDTFGWVNLIQGNIEQAISVLERAIKADGDNPEIRYHLGAAYLRAGRSTEAREALQLSLASDTEFEGVEQAKRLLSELGEG